MNTSKKHLFITAGIIAMLLTQILYDPISSARHSLEVSSVRNGLPKAHATWISTGITDYTFEIIGKDNGARLAVNVRSTESADLGHLVTIRAINQPSLTKHFLDTNVTTTLALLETYVVGS